MTPEFSRPVAVQELGPGPNKFELSAETGERRALARRFGLLSLTRLDAWITIQPGADGQRLSLRADFRADVVQSCVVSTEPVESQIEAALDLHFAPSDEIARERIVEIELDAEDPPEAIFDGQIDMGEVIAEHLALELDPFPRAEGATFNGMETGDQMDGGEKSLAGPLAALAKLRPKIK
jgi:uncharacterized metal-binding protein YceD (DUF177 family)